MIQPRVVIDTNVLVSAGIKPGSSEEAVLFLVADDQLQLFLSKEIQEEYESVLRRRKLRLAATRIEFVLRLAMANAIFVERAECLSVSPDESDNRFLECAEVSEADYLVTGNKPHFPLRWKGTEVVNARELLSRLNPQ